MNIKVFATSSGILIISNVLLKAVNFFLIPIYTKYLTTEMLGISDTITTFTGLLFPICIMGLDSAFSAFYYDAKEKQAEKVFHTILFALIIIGFIPVILCSFSSQISYLLFNTMAYAMIVTLALISVSFNIWYMPFALNLRMKNKMLLYSFVNVISSIIMVILNIIFVVVIKLGALSLILSTAIVHAGQFILFVIVNRTKIEKKYFEWSLLIKMTKFALPLVPGVILSWVLSLSDRYMLLYFNSVKAVGLYGIGTRLVSVLNIFISSVNTAYTTFAYSAKNENNAKEKYVKVFDLMVFVLAIICFTVALYSKEIILVMTAPCYHSSYIVVRDLMFAQLFYGVTSIVAYGIFFEKKSQYSLIATASGAITNILLNIYLIPEYGINAAALTTLIGYVVAFLCTYFFAQKLYYCEYKIKKMFILLGLLYSISYFSMSINLLNRCMIWVFTIIIVIVYYKAMLKDLWKLFITKNE